MVSPLRFLAPTLLAWLVAPAIVHADLTQEQIRAALGSPPELTWSLSGASAASWQTNERGLFASSSTEYGIETTVNGPGLISLSAKSDGAIEARVFVDGIASGGLATGYEQPLRVEVPGGSHVIKWSARRQFIYGQPVAFSNLRWEPFLEVSLDKAKAGTGIALAAGGTKPWRGQNAWHRGDGGAAWSGLRISRTTGATPEPQEPLTATVQGPAVLSFHARFRGYGPSTFRIDGKKNALILGAEGDWKRNLSWVGPGTHIATWEAGYYLAGSRYDFDLAVDDVELLPLIPHATALDTSQAEWTTTANSTSGQQPFGISDPQATGGSLVVLPVSTSLATRVTGPALISLRTDSGPVIEVDGEEVRPALIGQASLGVWRTLAWTIGEGDHDLWIGNPWVEQGVQIDQLKIDSPTGTLEQTLGLPDGSLATGGRSGWEIVPMPGVNGYATRATLDQEHPEGWLETTVEGPMEISFTLADTGGWEALKLMVDEVPVIATGAQNTSTRPKLEIPQGTHVIRWLAELPADYHYDEPLEVTLSGVQMLRLDPPGKLLAALDTNLPVVTGPVWHVTREIVGAEGGASAQPGDTEESTSHTLSTGFVGPGYFEFRWHASLDEWGNEEGSWWFDCLTTGLFSTFDGSDSSSDWRAERHWFPPGYHRVQWRFFGSYGDFAQAALDGVHFTPTPTVDLAASLDATEMPWENDVSAPWLGAMREDPEDDFAVSPALAGNETSRLTTTVTGPGELSFVWKNIGSLHNGSAELRINGITCAELYDRYNPLPVSIRVTDRGPSVVEWIVTGEISRDNANIRVELDQVRWDPYFTSPWAEALDTGKGVKWRSGGDAPFGGSDVPGAMGGTAAMTIVKSGESAWLEATVNGPGLFDPRLLGAADFDLDGNPWIYWTLTIDGTPVAVNYTTGSEPFWITGSGTHRIRLTLRIPGWKEGEREWIAGAVDQVSWQPMKRVGLNKGGGMARLNWKSGSPIAPTAFSRAGRYNKPAIVLNTMGNRPCWVETKVQGPCELSWDSTLSGNSATFWTPRNSLLIDGAGAIPMTPHGWQRMRLSLPSGPHTIRWQCDPYEEWWEGDGQDEAQPVAFDAMWRIGNLSIQRGASRLSETLDVPELFALETGDNGGSTITLAGEDAWQPEPGSSLYFFLPSHAAKVETLWGRPGKASGAWRQEDQNGYGATNLTSQGGSWESHVGALAPGRFSKWTYQHKSGHEVPLLASLSIDSSPAKEMTEAVESTTDIETEGWIGRDDDESPSGSDSAWSFLDGLGTNFNHVAETTVVGPARLSFWWKREGTSTLSVSLDGGLLPVPPVTETWTRVELTVNPGSHVVRWSHDTAPGTNHVTPSEAWLDGFLLTNAAGKSLDQAASLDPAVTLSSHDDAPLSWHPVAHAEADGSWTEAVRAISGSRVLKTTVTGPAVLSFRARAFTGLPAQEIARTQALGSTGSSPGWPPGGGGEIHPTVLALFLAVQVDGATVDRLDSTTAGAWQDMSVQVPEGSHEISFQLMGRFYSWLFREYEAETDHPTLQGWLDDFRLQPIASPLATANEEHAVIDNDADHDGASDDLEYWLGSAPGDPSSVPPALEIHTTPGQPLAPATWLMIPYLPLHASGGVLETSSDLVEWRALDVPLLHEPSFEGSSLSMPQATATHYPWAVPPGESRQYFRLRFPDRTD